MSLPHFTWADLPPKSPHRRFLRVVGEDGKLREATDRDIYLNYIRVEWAAAGQVVPPAVMAKAAADYDAAEPGQGDDGGETPGG